MTRLEIQLRELEQIVEHEKKYFHEQLREILIAYEQEMWEGDKPFTREIAEEQVDKYLNKYLNNL
jgi:hypothetical protein